MSKESTKETIDFKAEVAQVLNLVINSLYSHPEVFLRELISNASDAIDKHKHHTLTDEAFPKPAHPYAIKITPNKEKKTLVISDNGIGMSREEVIANIGTIASSGTKAFLEQMKTNKEKNMDLIGQFGVGFYSAFMVAKQITVETKRAGQETAAIRWISDGTGGYSLEEIEKSEPGTQITLEMKDDQVKFLEEWEIKGIVKKYSDYVSHPISLVNEKGEEETINKVTAIWRRAKSDIKEEEYNEFYKYISHDMDDPLAYIHNSIEGALEFRMLLYIPKKAPANFFREDIRGIRLHVKKMFITDECKELLPVYLRFIRGVVDSEDLPLNVSREMLQHGAVIQKIQKQLVKKVFDLFESMAKKDPEKYKEFYLELGVALKEGITQDFENREKILKLLRYPSSIGNTAKDLTSLEDYVKRMKPEQKDIYYVSGTSIEACKQNPHLAWFLEKGIEVLFMTDVIDEWATPALAQFDGKKLQSITSGNLDLGDLDKEVKEKKEKSDTEYKKLKEKIHAALQDDVKEVKLGFRLQDSPCSLVTDEGDMNANMEKIMRQMGQPFTPAKRILEINPEHAIFKNMQALIEKDEKDKRIAEWSEVLYNQALLQEGTPLKDPADFAKKISALLQDVTQKI